jgi:hypothetical protein
MRVMEPDRDVRKGAGVVRGVRGGRRRGRAALAAALGIAATASVLAHQAPASAETPPWTYVLGMVESTSKFGDRPSSTRIGDELFTWLGTHGRYVTGNRTNLDGAKRDNSWTFSRWGNGTWQIRYRGSGQCLAHLANGDGLTMRDCAPRGDQMWVWTDTRQNWWYTLRGLGRPAESTLWFRLTPVA